MEECNIEDLIQMEPAIVLQQYEWFKLMAAAKQITAHFNGEGNVPPENAANMDQRNDQQDKNQQKEKKK